MQNAMSALILAALCALSACGNLPPARIPVQPNANQGGGAAYLRATSGPAIP